MKKKIILTMLSIILIISLCQNTVAFAIDSIGNITAEDIVVNNVYNKLHFYFNEEQYHTIDSYSELVEATEYAVNHASEYAILSENSRGSEILTYQITVEFDSGFMDTEYYKALMAERETITTISEVRDFRSRLNSFSKNYHTQLIQGNMNMLGAVDYESANPVGYSPFVILDTEVENVTASALLSLARNNQVMNISVSGEEEVAPIEEVEETETTASVAATASDPNTWEQALRNINAYDIVTNGTYTGEGIRIGILENSGVCDTQNPGLSGKDIHPRPGQPTHTHPTAVTLVATCIAPDATYYVSKRVPGEGLAWFIENGCDVVNFSGAISIENRENCYEYSIDAIFDYQVQAHCINFVKSAGNNGNTITSPGYAYNCITVGGAYIDAVGDLVRKPSSSYISSSPLVKPNIVTNYTITDLPYRTASIEGTSIAAPQATACIALLLEYNPSYILFPEEILSVITSSSRKTSDYVDGTLDYGWFDDGVGAGILDLERMIACEDIYTVYNDYYGGLLGYEVINRQEYLTAGTELQVAVAWLAKVEGTVSEYGISRVTDIYLTDYDLYIYDSYGNIIAESSLIDSNLEMIRIDIAVSGIYNIVVEQWSTQDPDNHYDYVALTYNTHTFSN